MKKLSTLLDINLAGDVEIAGLTLDSRQVTEGTLFIAIKGHVVDGREFISAAIEKGAVAILAEAGLPTEHLQIYFVNNVPVIQYYNLGCDLSKIAGDFYDDPSSKLRLVGITGTNGKTTISQLLAQWATLLGHTSAVMGTIGNGLLGRLSESKNTTGSAVEIQSQLAQFVAQDADFAAIEVSSHGLSQHRVEALHFDAAIFTNLSRDHLDYHHTMEAYGEAKKRLFTELDVGLRVLNVDDFCAKAWLKDLPPVIEVSVDPHYRPISSRWIKALSIHFTDRGTSIGFSSSWGDGIFHSELIGEFNVSNLLLAAATLLGLGYPLSELIITASRLKGVCGRMEVIKENGFPTVLVDYAHTPDALEKALLAAREHCKGRLWCVFGCGGDRDSGKRPLMGGIANRLADFVIVTMDNPRTEDPIKIEADILAGVGDRNTVALITNRQDAIEFAVGGAIEEDVILIAGKGHEDYQIIGNKMHYFSDQEVVRQYINRKREPQND